MKKVISKSYTLRDEQGNWLAQVVLTSDGMFSAVSEYGNFAYAWRSTGDLSIEQFISQLDTDYFADKMRLGLAYSINRTKQVDNACKFFAEKVLPPLQTLLRSEAQEAP